MFRKSVRQELVTGWVWAVKEKEIVLIPALNVHTDECVINHRRAGLHKPLSILSQIG